MSKTKHPHTVVLARARELVDLLRPACEQIEIAGSLRRNESGSTAHRVGDIEIVCLPKTSEQTLPAQLNMFDTAAPQAREQRISQLDPLLDSLIERGILHRDYPYGGRKGKWGNRFKMLWTKWAVDANGEKITYVVQVDLFIVLPPSQWGAQFLIRTGPRDFNQALMGYINWYTPFKQKDGQLVDAQTGSIVDTPTERDYFRALGLPFIAPHRRTKETVEAWSRGKKKRPDVHTPPIAPTDPNAVAVVMDGQPLTHADVAQLADGTTPAQPVQRAGGTALPLTTQIKAILRANPRSHRIGVLQRLNCPNAEFALAIDTLKALNEITEDDDHFLSLVPQYPQSTVSRARQNTLSTAYQQFAGRAGVSDHFVRARIRARLMARAGLEHAA